jgi:hypothetical protein
MSAPRSPRARALFWVAATAGWAGIVWGVVGALHDRRLTDPPNLIQWFATVLLAHDLLLVPTALGLAWLVGHFVPRRAAVPARLGLAASALITALAVPLVRRYGARDSNPSLLPLRYGRNLALALLITWIVVVVTAAAVDRKRRV